MLKISNKESIKSSLLSVFILMTSFSYSQTTVTGKLVSSSGSAPIPGVNIVVKGTTNATSTDFDGNYSVDIARYSSILVFSYLGFITHEINIGGKSVIDVSLAEDVSALDEVVVVGYGTSKKRLFDRLAFAIVMPNWSING